MLPSPPTTMLPMIGRIVIVAGLSAFLALSAVAQELPKAPLPPVVDEDGLRTHLARTITSCWLRPPGYEGVEVAITIAFDGSGALTEDPIVELSDKSMAKMAPLAESARRAVIRCAPFGGLRQFGVLAHRQFRVIINFVP